MKDYLDWISNNPRMSIFFTFALIAVIGIFVEGLTRMIKWDGK